MELAGCPASVAGGLGGVLNMGGVLLRPAARGLLGAALARRGAYVTHCYDQELVNVQMRADGFRWVEYPRVGVVPSRAGGHSGVRVRLLDYARWPRDFGAQWLRNRTANGSALGKWRIVRPVPWHKTSSRRRADAAGCFFHPFNHKPAPSAMADTFAQHNLWYL